MFQDITTLLLDPKAFKDTIDLFVERYKGQNINVIAGKFSLSWIFFSFLFFFLLVFMLIYSEEIRFRNCVLQLRD